MKKPLAIVTVFALILGQIPAYTAHAGGSPGNKEDPVFDAVFEQELAQLRTAYLANKPVEQAVTEASLTALENPPGAPTVEMAKWAGVRRMERIRDLAKLVTAASVVQVQRDPTIKKSLEFKQNLDLIAVRMKLSSQQKKMAEVLYGDPDRAPKPPATPEERKKLEEERASVERMLEKATGHQRNYLRNKLSQLDLKLWDKPEFDLDAPQLAAFGVVAGPDGRIRKDVDFAALNAQSGGGLNSLKVVAVPVPQAAMQSLGKIEQRYQQAFNNQLAKENAVKADAQRLAEESGGVGLLRVGEAQRFWDAMDKSADKDGWFIGSLKNATSKTAKGLLWVSGLREVEKSAANAGYLSGSSDVRQSEKNWAGLKLAGNSALSFLTFLPAVGFAGQLGKGGQAAKLTPVFSRGGQAIKGLGAAAPKAQSAITTTGKQMKSVIDDVIPKGTPPNKQQLKTLFSEMNEKVGKKYGLSIEVGGTTGESISKGNKILASLDAGAPHEALHALQQLKTRIAMLERHAAKLGQNVDELTAAQRKIALQNAEKFERAAYAQHEMQAMYATGFGGTGKNEYARYLSQSMDDLGVALQNGTVIKGSYGAGSQMYGRVGAAMGDSQRALATNMTSSGIVFTKVTNEFLAELMR